MYVFIFGSHTLPSVHSVGSFDAMYAESSAGTGEHRGARAAVEAGAVAGGGGIIEGVSGSAAQSKA